MSVKTVDAALSASGVPCVHVAYPVGAAPALPWMTFCVDEDDPVIADNKRYANLTRWRVELYQKAYDADVEKRVTNAIEQAFGVYRKTLDTWVDEENCHMAAYVFTEREE